MYRITHIKNNKTAYKNKPETNNTNLLFTYRYYLQIQYL